MTALTLLIIIKIVVTIIAVSIPFLFVPHHKLEKLSGFETNNPLIFRLYGIAITSLLLGYGSGIISAEQGIFPTGIVVMGILSNCGAAFVIFLYETTFLNRVLGGIFLSIGLVLSAAFVKQVWWITTVI
ncbi:hypothetical protein ACFSJY_16645 [Thalassotalea euphylliae]|uniref:hypothetical protein n=1 Tax=Thalassotalea euphylliae TaxID=1655234 RepID=UPI003636C687